MKKYLLLSVFILVAAGFFTTQVYAMMNSQTGCSHEDESNFGQHVSMMTPEHSKIHGAMFGSIVSDMAKMHSMQSNHMRYYG